VTGVQTCALPILLPLFIWWSAEKNSGSYGPPHKIVLETLLAKVKLTYTFWLKKKF